MELVDIGDIVAALPPMTFGAIYALGGRRLRDAAVRTLQREGYVTFVRILGAVLMLAGLAMLVGVAAGRLPK
jgi:hypothetical protein